MPTLEVRLHDIKVGTLTRDRSGRTEFSFDDDWLSTNDRVTLSLAMTPLGVSSPVLERELAIGGSNLPPFFENLLPENNSRNYIASVNGIKPSNGFALLARTGRNLFGAVTVISDDQDVTQPNIQAHTKVSDDRINATFSLAGVQKKLSMLAASTNRLTASVDDDWIIKIPDAQYPDLLANEVGMMRLAKSAGFNVPDVDRVTLYFDDPSKSPLDGRNSSEAMIIRRFDRSDTGRIHAEDLAQATGTLPVQKYSLNHEFITKLMTYNGVDTAEMIRRIVLNIVTGNGDGHAKNFSVIYPDRINPVISPVYDIVSTVMYGDDSLAMKLGGKKLWDEMGEDALIAFSEKLELSASTTLDLAKETIDRVLGSWNEVKNDMPQWQQDALESHWKSGCALTRRAIWSSGFPSALPRIPNHDDQTHEATRSKEASIVRRKTDGKVDNPIDAAVVKSDGEEIYMRDGQKVSKGALVRKNPIQAATDKKTYD